MIEATDPADRDSTDRRATDLRASVSAGADLLVGDPPVGDLRTTVCPEMAGRPETTDQRASDQRASDQRATGRPAIAPHMTDRDTTDHGAAGPIPIDRRSTVPAATTVRLAAALRTTDRGGMTIRLLTASGKMGRGATAGKSSIGRRGKIGARSIGLRGKIGARSTAPVAFARKAGESGSHAAPAVPFGRSTIVRLGRWPPTRVSSSPRTRSSSAGAGR
jgi:hypothetical protein